MNASTSIDSSDFRFLPVVAPSQGASCSGSIGQAAGGLNPFTSLQNRIDALFHNTIKPCLPKSSDELKKIDPSRYTLVDQVNAFLDRADGTTKKAQAAWILVKLIPRAIRSVLSLVYHMVAICIKLLVHPMRTTREIAHFLKALFQIFQHPKFYTSAGAGLLGTAVGQGILSPQSILLYIIGAGLIAFGLLCGSLQSIAAAPKGFRWDGWVDQMWDQIKEMPEAFAIGLMIGLTLGAVEKAHLVDTGNPSGQILGLADDIQPLAPLLSQES